MNTEQISPRSSAAKPDLDWSQVRETVLMLNLAIAQIERTMMEGDESINALADSFTNMVGNTQIIGMAAENLPDCEEKDVILTNHQAVSDKIHAAIVAFQFYDKLAQRLAHVSHSLDALGDLVAVPERLYNPYEWSGLQEKIKSKYTIESDRAMFDAILNGRSLEEALDISKQHQAKDDDKDDIELF